MGNSVMGRPRIEFDEKDWERIENLCKIQCTKEEISSVMGVSEDTLENKIRESYDCTFSAYYKKHQGQGKASLRRMQWKSAEAGNSTMLVWLGKQVLDQTDKQEIKNEINTNKIDDILDQLK